MMSQWFLLLSILLAYSFAQNARAGVLIFESSDQHSTYSQLPDFIRSTSVLAREFQAKHPGSPVVHFINGDLAGPSQYTDFDNGRLNYSVLAQLARHYGIIMNLGNHEAFDYMGARGNQLFKDQVEDFILMSGVESFKTANIQPGKDGREIFSNHQDIITSKGVRIRVVGLVLDELFSYSTYSRTSEPEILQDVRSMLEEAKKQLEQAAADGITRVIFQCHEEYMKVAPMLEKLLEWKKTQAQLASMEVPVVFAGHDHTVRKSMVQSTLLADGGAGYEFYRIELDDDGNLIAHEHYNRQKQQEVVTKSAESLLPGEKAALSSFEPLFARVMKLNSQVVVSPIASFPETRFDLKRERQPLGTTISDALAEWAHDMASKEATDVSIARAIAFYNSGSYRGEKPLAQGDFTLGQLKQFYPMPGMPSVIIASGAMVQEMFTALREYGIKENQYTPQLPSFMREGENFKLELHGSDGAWAPLEKNAQYALALDPWLEHNGFNIPGPAWNYKDWRKLTLHVNGLVDVLRQYVLEKLKTRISPCEAALGVMK